MSSQQCVLLANNAPQGLPSLAYLAPIATHLCHALLPLPRAPLLATPLCVLCLVQLNNNAPHSNPDTGNMLHTLPTTAMVVFLFNLCLNRT